MIYDFVMFKDRVPYLLEELGDRITIGEEYKNDMVIVKIRIDRGSDLLHIFHAGISLGVNKMKR